MQLWILLTGLRRRGGGSTKEAYTVIHTVALQHGGRTSMVKSISINSAVQTQSKKKFSQILEMEKL